MSSVEDRYYKLNRILLKLLGLWPYQNSKCARVHVIIMTSLYLSAIFVQLAVFITHECTWDLTVHVFSTTFPSIGTFFIYDIYYFNSDVMKEIMQHMYYDWTSCKHVTEYSIMDNYADRVRLLTKVFGYLLCVGIFGNIIFHAAPIILDAISPLNVNRRRVYLEVEYFVDPIKYQCLLTCHVVICISLLLVTTVVVGLTLLSYCFHACAMFKIANYRMQIIMDADVLQTYTSEMEHIIFGRITYAVDVHRRAIEYIKLLISNLGRPFLFGIMVIVVSLSLNLFRFFKAITAFTEISEVGIAINLLFAHFCYIFLGNHLGQQITNCNAEIFITVCNLPWYIAPVNIQKLLLFILQKCNKDIYLSAGGLFEASHEGITTLLMSSVSYFTLICTLQ